ncbi:MAG: calcium-binding protein, partial [Solirubrobacterales bacterium]
GAAGTQPYSGRPSTRPYGFVIKVTATLKDEPLLGQDRRAGFLHRDAQMIDGFPKQLDGDGEASPLLVDLDGDNRNELIVATADGFVHAYTYDPGSGEVGELQGWPVRGDVPGFVDSHSEGEAYASGAVGTDLGGSMITAVSAADANANGIPEVYVADFEGHVYGWNAQGERIFDEASNPAFSGKPLTPFVNVRQGHRNRTQRGFLGSPVLADLDRDDDGRLEIIAAGLDRHVYAWNHDGTPVDGYPVLVVDPTKVASVDPATHAVSFDADAGPALNQGAIVDTPAVGDITGDARPEIIVGTNEEYAVDEGDEGPLNVAPSSAPSLNLLAPVGLLSFANGRAYAISPDGDPDAPAAGQSPFLGGWPVPIGIALAEVLPLVGEGINGSPVIADITCQGGSGGPKVGLMPAAGPAYLLNPDGSSCFGQEEGRHKTFASDVSGGAGQIDRPVIPAVGVPAFGDLGDAQPAFIAPAAGVIRALDLALNDYQTGGQDFTVAWDTSTGVIRPGFPAAQNDLSFLTGPAVGDVGGAPGEEIVAGTSSMDLVATTSTGIQTSTAWPKLTPDWTIATPLLGSFGTLDTDPAAPRVVVNLTRSGEVNAYATDAQACAPASSPRFHHDNANSGDYRRDAVLPGKPAGLIRDGDAIEFIAPGDDLMCGTADAYEIATSANPIDESNFESATPLTGAPDPAAAGAAESYTVPGTAARYVAVRAVDEQGNVGRVASVDFGGPPPGACENVIGGTPGDDAITGTPDGDRISGGDGADELRGEGGDDCVLGQRGRDALFGGIGDDLVRGGRGADLVRGGEDGDRVRGGPGADRLRGDAGDDHLKDLSRGRDRINCGAGDDTAVVRKGDRVKNCETVERR